MKRFNAYLDLVDMTPLRDFCMAYGALASYERGDRFLQEGEVGKYFGYVLNGYFKYEVLHTSGDEAVGGFAFADEYVTDLYNSYYGLPSEVSITAAGRSDIYRVPMAAFRKFICEENPDTERCLLGALYRTIYKRYVQNYRYTTEEKYRLLLSDHPDIFDMVSLKDIASYLMISPVYLSRIRKKLRGTF